MGVYSKSSVMCLLRLVAIIVIIILIATPPLLLPHPLTATLSHLLRLFLQPKSQISSERTVWSARLAWPVPVRARCPRSRR